MNYISEQTKPKPARKPKKTNPQPVEKEKRSDDSSVLGSEDGKKGSSSKSSEKYPESDFHLGKLDPNKPSDVEVMDKLKSNWGVSPDKFVKKLTDQKVTNCDENKETYVDVNFYATNKSKVFLGSYKYNPEKPGCQNTLALVKDVKGGREDSSDSLFTLTQLQGMDKDDMISMINRVVMINENLKSMNGKVMKNILKEEFQKRENDKNIISKRFNILSESKKTWTASSLISEVNYLKKQNYSSVLIKEGLVELMKSLYDDDPTFIPKIKDSYKGWLMKKLPNESELFKKSLETSIEDLENDSVPALFTDCNKVVEMMYEAMIKGMVDEKFDVVGVPKDIEDLLRSEIIDNIKKDEFKSKVKQQLTNKICPQYGDLLKNTQKTFDDIKNKLVS